LKNLALFPNRRRAIQATVSEKFTRMERGRLTSECAKIDPTFEKSLAEEGLGQEIKRSMQER